ncbi:hypothetical protein EES43_12515 [Streptomyces sp. ADI96-02]|nr:hypothetical protein EES43_12515 [Streptomyces sp. ADI96-02]
MFTVHEGVRSLNRQNGLVGAQNPVRGDVLTEQNRPDKLFLNGPF